MEKLSPILKTKVQSISDYSSEPLIQDEINELGSIVIDKEVDIEERILAAKVMTNVCSNRLLRAQRQVKYWSNIHLALEHEFHRERELDKLVQDANDKLDLENPDVIALLEAMLEASKK